MAKQRHQPTEQSSKGALVGMAVAGLAVAALVVWALTRTVQPAPPATTQAPMVVEQPAATNTLPPLDPATGSFPPGQTVPPASTATMAPPATDENASVKRMSVPDLQARLSANQITVVDVRDLASYGGGHIPGALHVPLASVESQLMSLPKNRPIVTYCT